MKHRIHAEYAAAFLLITGTLTALFGTQLYGLWMILKSMVYFAAGGSREAYLTSVFGRFTGYGVVSVIVLLLSVFLAIGALFFLSTGYGRRVGSEFGIMLRYLMEKFCVYFSYFFHPFLSLNSLLDVIFLSKYRIPFLFFAR